MMHPVQYVIWKFHIIILNEFAEFKTIWCQQTWAEKVQYVTTKLNFT